jgi:hypothetical protein
MPEITTEWQRFETLMAGELYELLRFRRVSLSSSSARPIPTLMA